MLSVPEKKREQYSRNIPELPADVQALWRPEPHTKQAPRA